MKSRRTYKQMLSDVVREFQECEDITITTVQLNIKLKTGTVTTAVKLNVRKEPFTESDIIEVLRSNTVVNYDAIVENRQTVNDNSTWYRDIRGNFFWRGRVK